MLKPSDFIHPEDAAALQQLESIPGFPTLVKKVLSLGLEQLQYGINMASTIRLSPKQLPELYNHLPPICEKLGIDEPEFYLSMDPNPNAWTFGDTKIYITITSGLIEMMNDEELDCVLAHECGHILCRHVLYHTIAQYVLSGIDSLGILGTLTIPIQYAILYWERKSELSCDRAASIITSPEVVAHTMARLTGGPLSITEKRKEHQNELIHNIQLHSAKVDELRAFIVEEVALRMDGNKEMNVLGINNRIKEWGKTVFMVTAISQNSKFDSIAVLVMNYKLISDIVLATGFRPTKPQLFKLYIQVLTTALITYCTSQVLTDVDSVAPFDFGDDVDIDELDADMDIDDIDVDESEFGSGIMGKLKKLTIPGILIGSAIEGCINALMTMRIGYVTRAYLTEGSQALSGIKNKRKVKRQAIGNAFKSMPGVIADSSAVIGKTVASKLKLLFEGKEETQ